LRIYTDVPQGWTIDIPTEHNWIKVNGALTASYDNSVVPFVSATIQIICDPNNTSNPRFGSFFIVAGNLRKEIKVRQDLDVSTIPALPSRPLDNPYVGAFWRASERGERIIRFTNVSAANSGDWTASVVWMDSRWNAGDIVLDTELLSTADLATRNISYTNTGVPFDNPNPAESYLLYGNETSISGTVATGGEIIFRIGLKNTYTPTAQHPVRYAVITLTYGNPVMTQKIFLRQGEDADYLMRPTDLVNGNLRTAARFSPYNLTSDALNGPSIPVRGGQFTKYPTQAGAYFQWASNTNIRFAWSPIGLPSPSDYTQDPAVGYWNTLGSIYETCPIGWRRPTSGTISGSALNNTPALMNNSEILASLKTVPTGSAVSGGNNFANLLVYYADGFFDRHAIGTSPTNTANSAILTSTTNIAYSGMLFYNNSADSQASLFLPAAGYRVNNGTLSSTGSTGTYWISSAPTDTRAWSLFFSTAIHYAADIEHRQYGFSVRCVQE
jgi:hypothetical protein